MYLVGVTLRWLKCLRYAPEVENVRYAPDMSRHSTNTGIPHRDVRGSMLRGHSGANAKLVS